jgi:hypothetical protein
VEEIYKLNVANMRKRNLTGPFWLLLIFGFFKALSASAWISFFLSLQVEKRYLYDSRLNLWLLVFWPVLIIAEALLYWRIRHRNIYPRASWLHVMLLFFAFLLPVLKSITRIIVYDRINVRTDSLVYGRKADNTNNYLFWIIMVIAHCFFVWVIINCFKKKAPVPEDIQTVNLLDDFLT